MENENKNVSPRADMPGNPPVLAYEIRVQGCVDAVFWSDWFGDLAFTIDPVHSQACLRSLVADQAELFGLLSRLRNKGLTLISVQQLRDES